jgi:hypothetical protein
MSASSCSAGSSWPIATWFPPRGTDFEKKRPIAASVVPLPTSPAHATKDTTLPLVGSSLNCFGRPAKLAVVNPVRARCRDSRTACNKGIVSASVPDG